jgi:hypothetical protein
VTVTEAGDPSTINLDRVVVFEDGIVDMTGRAPSFAAIAQTLGVSEDVLMEAMGDPREGAPDTAAIAEALGVSETDLMDAMDQ